MAPVAQAIKNKDALWDIKPTKKYILDTFKYREYAEKKARMYWQAIIKKMQKINR